jgi:autotransporter translocation and assembly factor TamB
MSDLRTAAQQALNSLRGYRREIGCEQPCDAERALEAALTEEALQRLTDANQEIEAALEQPEQETEPKSTWQKLYEAAIDQRNEAVAEVKRLLEQPVDAEAALRFALAQRDWAFKQLQAQPDRREWRGLTQGEHEKTRHVCRHVGVEGLVLWLEDKLKEKNHE